MGKKPDGTPYVEYYLSIHWSYCRGPADAWTGLRIKDKDLFKDFEKYFDNTKIAVNEPDMFGGHLREGGLVGDIHFMNGGGAQKIPDALAKRLDLTPNTAPGYRGVTSIFMCGNDDTGAKGFAWACNNPQVPNAEARFRRKSDQLDNNQKVITFETADGDTWHNSNPAHIIYECLVHKDLMNGRPSLIDEPSFQYASGVFNDEKFGISLLWTATDRVESFVQEVLNHVNSLLFLNPYNGKLTIKPLRNDYDVETLTQIGPDQAIVKTFRRPLWGETVNEIVVNYTNPRKEEQESITFQDLANIAMQREVVSETRDYRGIRDRELARDVAARELRVACTPLATADIQINRQLINITEDRPFLPGDVFVLNYPLYGAAKIVFRIMEVDWGSVDDSKILLKCVEDVFGFPYAKWEPPDDTAWEPPDKDPDDPIFNEVEYLFRATPISLINRRAPQFGSDPFSVDDPKWPQIAINTYILPTDEQFDLQYYFPHRPAVDTLGNPTWKQIGEKRVVGHTSMIGGIGQEVKSNITMNPYIGPGDWPKKGWLGMFVGEDEFTDELFVFEEKLEPDEDGNPRWRIRRGVLDTIPWEWPSGAKIIIHANNYNGYDWSGRFAFVNEEYRFKIRTSNGISDLGPIVQTNRPDRPYMPYRPADCKIAGVRFGTSDHRQMIDPDADYDMFALEHEPREWEIEFTWARRNRFAEDQVWLAWNDPDVPPEDDQTTEIIIMLGDTEIDRVTGLTGTSYTLPLMEKTARYTDMNFKFISRRPHPDYPDGITSLQGVVINLKLYMKGYGSDWDYFWGGWPEGTILTDIDDFDVQGYLPTADIETEN